MGGDAARSAGAQRVAGAGPGARGGRRLLAPGAARRRGGRGPALRRGDAGAHRGVPGGGRASPGTAGASFAFEPLVPRAPEEREAMPAARWRSARTWCSAGSRGPTAPSSPTTRRSSPAISATAPGAAAGLLSIEEADDLDAVERAPGAGRAPRRGTAARARRCAGRRSPRTTARTARSRTPARAARAGSSCRGRRARASRSSSPTSSPRPSPRGGGCWSFARRGRRSTWWWSGSPGGSARAGGDRARRAARPGRGCEAIAETLEQLEGTSAARPDLERGALDNEREHALAMGRVTARSGGARGVRRSSPAEGGPPGLARLLERALATTAGPCRICARSSPA